MSLIALQDGQEVFSSTGTGVRPLLELVEQFPAGLPGAAVIDRVVGGCAARIFVHLGVDEVHAITLSEAGRRILAATNIRHTCLRHAPMIRNRAGTGTCPFEMLNEQHSSVATLLPAMRELLASMRRRAVS